MCGLLVVTLGDPHGVGIELVERCRDLLRVPGHRTVLIGHRWQWDHQIAALGAPPLAFEAISKFEDLKHFRESTESIFFFDSSPNMPHQDAASLTESQCGSVAVAALLALQELDMKSFGQEERLAVVTAPIDKHAAKLAGWQWGGQTEYFERLWGHPAIMILAGDTLRVALATNHLALQEVPAAINQASLQSKLALLVGSLQEQFGVRRPRIAVCGLNPHAGDGGLFGSQDLKIIAPAIAAFAANHPDVEVCGPVPADTVFAKARAGQFDAVLAMYHDQGLGPLKTVHFDDAVNLSGGLPHLRISPDHGPARDLYLARKASDRSMAAALRHGARYLSETL